MLGWTIRFGGEKFLVGSQVNSFFDSELLTLEYIWAFYTSDKVVLGLCAGLSVTTLRTGITAAESDGGNSVDVKVTVLIPTIGGRLGYRVTPKLSVLARFDLLSLDLGDYSGLLLDSRFAAEHHTFKHVGFGGSIGT